MHVSDAGQARPAAGGPGRRRAAAPPRPLRVLLVDDEDAVRLTIGMVLARRGHEVVGAGTVDEARLRAREGRFDAALVDLRLPGNGLNLLAELEATEALAGRTVLVTGSCEVLAETELWPRCLAKPFDYDELIALVEELGG